MAKQKDFASLSIKELYEGAIDEFQQYILWKIENIYESAIEMFYNDYEPLWYQRTESTYLASSGALHLYSPENMKFITPDITEIGITVGSENIPGSPYRADKEWVFNRTFKQGIHGISARAMFGKKRDRVYQRGIGRERFRTIRGKSVKTKHGYETRYTVVERHYRGVAVRVMNNMSPTPKGIVNREFKKFAGKRNLDRLFRSILESRIES